MKSFKSKFLNAVVFGFIATTAFAHSSGGIVVKDAWVREGPPNVKVLAAYMTIENHTDKEKALSSITSPDFKKIEIHHTIYKEGMASMQQMQQLASTSSLQHC